MALPGLLYVPINAESSEMSAQWQWKWW